MPVSPSDPDPDIQQKSIAVLYICTGAYYIFWNDFYLSANRYLLPALKKHFFVFSDTDASFFASPDVTRIYQKQLGWPDATIRRFHMFQTIHDELIKYDYIFFFNANCLFIDFVGEEMLPSIEEKLTVVMHPGYYNKDINSFTYDRNSASKAFIPYGQGTHYVAGGVNGGLSADYI